jgi:hypothetical protein
MFIAGVLASSTVLMFFVVSAFEVRRTHATGKKPAEPGPKRGP